MDEGECSPPRQQHYKRRSPCALYPWRNRDSGLPLERDPKVASVSSEIHPANVDRSEDFCQEDLMPEPKLICRPSPLACLQRNVSDPLHQSKTVQIHQRSRSDPVFSFHNDVLADETEVTSPEEDDDFCALNRNPDRISEGMPDVFTGSRFDDISTIGGEADDERPSSDYRKRRPVLSWFHQGPYTSSSRRNEDCLKEDFDMSSPARIPRSSRRMVDEGDWSLDVPRRGSKTECEI